MVVRMQRKKRCAVRASTYFNARSYALALRISISCGSRLIFMLEQAVEQTKALVYLVRAFHLVPLTLL